MSDTESKPNPRAQRVKRPWWSPFTPGEVIDSTVDMRRDPSLQASAARLKATKAGQQQRRTETWMGEAWNMFDLVGELHFLSTTLARRAARARFYVGRVDGSDVIELEPPLSEVPEGQARQDAQANNPQKETAADRKARRAFEALGDGFIGLQEIVERAFLNQYVVGTVYLVGATAETWAKGKGGVPVKEAKLNDLQWRALSINEFKQNGADYELSQTGSANVTGTPMLKIPATHAYVVSIWNPHPADASVPDSPVRASLPILRELVGLTQHVSAQVDSRLAGAGMLIMRSSASRALKRAMGLPEDGPDDPLTEQLIDAMITPIGDRDSAAAIVPLVLTIPDEAQKPEYLSFSAPLDQYAETLRDSSIRRLALGLDAPPELLLGQGTTSHWTAWLTQEEVVDSHISPTLATFARGVTTGYLRPVLRANGLTEAQAEEYAIWFDVSGLTVKANMSADAQALYALDALSEESLRRAAGFDESDAPKKSDVNDQAKEAVFEMVKANPGLMNRPGIPVLVDQLVALLNGKPKPLAASSAPSQGPAAPDDEPPIAQPPSGTAPVVRARGVEGGGQGAEPIAAPTPNPAAPAARPPQGPQAPRTTVSTPGIPQTTAPSAADTTLFNEGGS